MLGLPAFVLTPADIKGRRGRGRPSSAAGLLALPAQNPLVQEFVGIVPDVFHALFQGLLDLGLLQEIGVEFRPLLLGGGGEDAPHRGGAARRAHGVKTVGRQLRNTAEGPSSTSSKLPASSSLQMSHTQYTALRPWDS